MSVLLPVRVNATRVPSGDHAGEKSPELPAVIGVGLEPSAPATQILNCEPDCAEKASRVPSGDHAGWRPGGRPVITCAPEPSACITLIDPPFEKAIWLPSGDIAGSSVPPPVVRRLRSEPSGATVQTSRPHS